MKVPIASRHNPSSIRFFGCTIMAALAGCGIARAATIIDSADDPAATVEAYRAEAALFPSVGKVGGGGLSGSGVYIGYGWVLTAAHVAQLKQVGGTFAAWGQTFAVQEVKIHPDFDSSGPFADIGLLRIGAEGTGDPAALYDLGSATALVGRESTWVGHGFTGTGLTGIQYSLDSRAFTNIIDALGDSIEGLPAGSFVADFDRPDGSTNALGAGEATRLEGNVVTGDSGGGVFVEINGQRYLVGISSYNGTLATFPGGVDGRYGGLSGATNLAVYYAWITQQTGIVPIPEPAAAMLGALSVLLLGRRRQAPERRQSPAATPDPARAESERRGRMSAHANRPLSGAWYHRSSAQWLEPASCWKPEDIRSAGADSQFARETWCRRRRG